MPNIASIINSHNKRIINNNIPKPSTPSCNCRSKTSFPLNGDCLQSSLVYICKEDNPNIIGNHPHWIGLTENTFKERFYKYKNSFKYESKYNTTERLNFVWENKHANKSEANLVRKINMPLKQILCGIYRLGQKNVPKNRSRITKVKGKFWQKAFYTLYYKPFSFCRL